MRDGDSLVSKRNFMVVNIHEDPATLMHFKHLRQAKKLAYLTEEIDWKT